ncbi:MAG TPA: hypothetical protein PLO61_06010 [Fimbriimonadaceae bacterium]|nr:hypothetical protein [Fimbriimonadaceae bacterium]HRJ34058.1 hypothetical protein [Fimbriimonadaceae bacterium]
MNKVATDHLSFADWAERKLVNLIVDHDASMDGTPPLVLTGFVVDVSDEWLWVTAAHCLEPIDVILRFAERALFALSPGTSGKPIPVNFQAPLKIAITDSQIQFTTIENLQSFSVPNTDVLLMKIPDAVVCYLMQHHYEPFNREHWHIDEADVTELRHDLDVEILLVGLPKTLQQLTGNTLTCEARRLPLAPINDGSKLPKIEFNPLWERDQFDSGVRGMSGGPIVGRIGARYFLFGCQSSQWTIENRYPSKLFVIAMESILEIVHRSISEVA